MTRAQFDRETLRQAFHDLGVLCHNEGKVVELSVYGGSALMLTYDWRVATRDVDAVFEADRDTVRRLAAVLARDRGWEPDWLNDGVKGFLSDGDRDARTLMGTYPSEERPGLRVMVANPAYPFAMKCRAMRIGGVHDTGDIEDIRRLADELGLRDAEAAFALIAAFYPHQVLQPKTRFGLEEIFDTMRSGEDGDEPRS